MSAFGGQAELRRQWAGADRVEVGSGELETGEAIVDTVEGTGIVVYRCKTRVAPRGTRAVRMEPWRRMVQ